MCSQLMSKNIFCFLFFFLSMFELTAITSDKIKKIRDLTVSIQTFDENNKPLGYGTGFVISENGLIATCFHVVENSSSATVKFPNSEIRYKVKQINEVDEGNDLALIKINLDRSGLILSNSKVEIGERVLAFGNPKGLEGTVSDGIISSIRVSGQKFPAPVLAGTKIIQTTAAISPGSSGGPIVNKDGEVIGIVVSTRNDGQNLNFALPVEYLSRLLKNKKKGVPSSKISFGGGKPLYGISKKIVKIGDRVEWLSVIRNKAKIYNRPSYQAQILGTMESLKALVFIESKKVGNTGMILVGEYIGNGNAQKIGWVSANDLF